MQLGDLPQRPPAQRARERQRKTHAFAVRHPFVVWLLTKLINCLYERRIVDGLWLHGDVGELDRVEAALRIIKTHDPLRYAGILRDLDRIRVARLFGSSGQYDKMLNACEIDAHFVLEEQTTSEAIAAVIVHEATHARLERCGIRYVEKSRERIEAVCLRQELRFARKLPDGAQIIEEHAQYYLDSPPDLTDAAFEKQIHEGMITATREVGVPEWLIQGVIKTARAIKRLRLRLSTARGRTGPASPNES